jgi:hypothetical protein
MGRRGIRHRIFRSEHSGWPDDCGRENAANLVAASQSADFEEQDLKITDLYRSNGRHMKSDTPESIITRADQLMYSSKRNGKNIVTFG